MGKVIWLRCRHRQSAGNFLELRVITVVTFVLADILFKFTNYMLLRQEEISDKIIAYFKKQRGARIRLSELEDVFYDTDIRADLYMYSVSILIDDGFIKPYDEHNM